MTWRLFELQPGPGRLLAPALIVLATAIDAGATTRDEALTLCRAELTDGEGAISLNEVDFRRHDEVPFVYGDAEFADGARAHFRCRVYHNRVTSVRYLTGDRLNKGDRAWTKERPAGSEFHALELDEAARTAPAPAEIEPNFEKVPSATD